MYDVLLDKVRDSIRGGLEDDEADGVDGVNGAKG